MTGSSGHSHGETPQVPKDAAHEAGRNWYMRIPQHKEREFYKHCEGTPYEVPNRPLPYFDVWKRQPSLVSGNYFAPDANYGIPWHQHRNRFRATILATCIGSIFPVWFFVKFGSKNNEDWAIDRSPEFRKHVVEAQKFSGDWQHFINRKRGGPVEYVKVPAPDPALYED